MFENKRFKDGRCITKKLGRATLRPYLRKLCHEFIQNFHQIESTKKIAAQKVKGRKRKVTQHMQKEARMDKLKKIATDCSLVFKNLLA